MGRIGIDTARVCIAATLASGCYTGLSQGGGGAAGADDGSGGTADDESGTAADETGGEPELPECADIGTQPLRRITSAQYRQILRDLLPPALADAALAVSTFPRTTIDAGFSTYATANTVSTNESIAIEDNAEAIAAVFDANRAEYAPELVPCLPAGYSAAELDGCIDGFVADFGARAFRRELTEGELEIVLGLYQSLRDSDGADAGLTAVLQYFLQSPALLYATEQSGDGELVALAPFELATRLSLLFLDSVPDAELRTAVAEGRLQTRDDVEREARRLVEGAAAKRAFATFHHEWMQGFDLEDSDRIHPLWTPDASAALREELGAFAQWFFDETDATFATLMTTQDFAPDARLDAVYAAGADEPGAGPRTGLLTTAAAMATQSRADATSLVVRGAFIRNHVLCNPTPPFPGELDTQTPLDGYGELPTGRQRLEPLMTETACSGCHVAINPLGFPFEVYDHVGAYRSQEQGADIDASTMIELGALSGSFANAAELLEAIAATDEARDCYAKHWFRYSLGRPEAPEDACVLDEIEATFAASGGDVRELLVAIAVSDAFRFRKTGGGG